MPTKTKTTVEETRNPDFDLQQPARARDEALAAAVSPLNYEGTPHSKPPTKTEFNADAPVVEVKGGVVVLSVGGNSTALSGDDVIRLGKQLSALSQLQTGQHFDRTED
jgi:chitinase